MHRPTVIRGGKRLPHLLVCLNRRRSLLRAQPQHQTSPAQRVQPFRQGLLRERTRLVHSQRQARNRHRRHGNSIRSKPRLQAGLRMVFQLKGLTRQVEASPQAGLIRLRRLPLLPSRPR